MEPIDEVIEALSDGLGHDLNELSTLKGLRHLSMTKLMGVLDFLAEYHFIELSQAWRGEPPRTVVEAKLQPRFQKFLREIKFVERTEKAGKV